MSTTLSTHASNCERITFQSLSPLSMDDFRNGIIEGVRSGARIAALFGQQSQGERAVRLYAVLADGNAGMLSLSSTDVAEKYPSLTPECPQAHWFEREIAEQCGVIPQAHPWLKPIRFHSPTLPGVTNFFQVEGEEIHEVAVGPVHAGIIEPGHFRFQCHGEQVLHLEVALGYQHRGAEQLLEGGPSPRGLRVAETIAGDTSIGHGLAYCRALEALAGVEAPPRASFLRGVALELERLANHVGDLGAMAGDVGFQPTAAACGALRAEYLNATAEICGNRFGRALLTPGGVRFDLSAGEAGRLADKLGTAFERVREAAQLFFRSPSTRNRTDGTGVVSRELALQLGLVGLAARASGLSRDVRRDHPFGLFRFSHLPVATAETGDVFARAWVRWLEIERSAAFVADHLRTLPESPLRARLPPLPPDRLAVSMVEGWRGEIVHVAVTDGDGRLARHKVKDPSFHNWMGLAQALRGEQVSDFPLCNKSFNLSYAGHDL